MQLPRTRNFLTFLLEKPSVFVNSEIEGTPFYFTEAGHKTQTSDQNKPDGSKKQSVPKASL